MVQPFDYNKYFDVAIEQIQQLRSPHATPLTHQTLGWRIIQSQAMTNIGGDEYDRFAAIVPGARVVTHNCILNVLWQLLREKAPQCKLIPPKSEQLSNAGIHFAFIDTVSNCLVIVTDKEPDILCVADDYIPDGVAQLLRATGVPSYKHVYLLHDYAYLQYIKHTVDTDDPGHGCGAYSLSWLFDTYFGEGEYLYFKEALSIYKKRVDEILGYDTASEVYGLYYDAASEIYSFYYDMASELYGRDLERAEKIYERFLEKIVKAKGQDSGSTNTDAMFDTTLRSASSVEELESVVDAHVTECVQALWAEWEALSTDIDAFDEYMASVENIEAFHTHIEDSASQIFVMICDYGIAYSELILQSGSSSKDMYNAFEDFKDCIYEDACEIVKDEIYEGLLNEIKDYYYDGIINDAKDSVEYSEWSDARGDAYSWWSDARGEVYSNWSDTRGDLYSFYSDMRSELYSGNAEGASDELQDFKDKIAKMK